MPLECRVLGLFGERWGEAAREPCGAPDGADRKLSHLNFLRREQRAGQTKLQLPWPRRRWKEGMLRLRGAPLARSTPLLLSCPSEAGGTNYYFPSLCVNLRIMCEPDGDIEHQRQVTVVVVVPFLTILAQAISMGVFGFIFWPFCSMAGLRA